MKSAIALTVLGTLAMAAGLAYGFAVGDGWDELRELMAYPWFVVSLVDVYVGFALFAGWVLFREKPAVSVPLVIAIMLLGNIVTCVYALAALLRSGGNWRRFWLGRYAAEHSA